MRDLPLISVVTPTLNQAPYLPWMLESVRRQTYPRIEHVVIDGGSTDGTLAVLREAAEAGRLSFVSEPDGGMYDAINKGLALVTGDILAYLNSDDAWFPWAAESALRVFGAKRDVDVVFGDGIKVNEETGGQWLRLFAPFEAGLLADAGSIMQPAVFFRRRVFDRIGGFDAELRYVADLDYWLRAAASGARFAHLDEVIAIERLHAARLSSAQREAMAREDRTMRDRHRSADPDAGRQDRALRREERWQRWLALRFAAAFAARPLVPGWRQFQRAGDVSLSTRRLRDGLRPGEFKRLWGAVTSARAAEILGARSAAPKRPGRARALLHRLRLLSITLPGLLPAVLAAPRD